MAEGKSTVEVPCQRVAAIGQLTMAQLYGPVLTGAGEVTAARTLAPKAARAAGHEIAARLVVSPGRKRHLEQMPDPLGENVVIGPGPLQLS